MPSAPQTASTFPLGRYSTLIRTPYRSEKTPGEIRFQGKDFSVLGNSPQRRRVYSKGSVISVGSCLI